MVRHEARKEERKKSEGAPPSSRAPVRCSASPTCLPRCCVASSGQLLPASNPLPSPAPLPAAELTKESVQEFVNEVSNTVRLGLP